MGRLKTGLSCLGVYGLRGWLPASHLAEVRQERKSWEGSRHSPSSIGGSSHKNRLFFRKCVGCNNANLSSCGIEGVIQEVALGCGELHILFGGK